MIPGPQQLLWTQCLILTSIAQYFRCVRSYWFRGQVAESEATTSSSSIATDCLRPIGAPGTIMQTQVSSIKAEIEQATNKVCLTRLASKTIQPSSIHVVGPSSLIDFVSGNAAGRSTHYRETRALMSYI